MKKIIVVNACILWMLVHLSSTSFGQAQTSGSLEQVGTSMANFLKIGVGARALAMGGAYVAACDDITALYWNPGALDRLQQNEVIAQQTTWLVESDLYFFGASYRVLNWGTVGLSAYYFSSGNIEETTLTQPDGTGRTFSAYDLALGLTYSKMITDRFSSGITVKMIEESLDREKARSIALDIGSVFQTGFLNDMKIGMSLSNLGGQMSLDGSDLSIQYSTNPDHPTRVVNANLDTEEWDIPLFFRFGLATNVMEREGNRLMVSSEVMDSRDFTHRLSLGSEWALRDMFFLRGGYKFNYDEDSFTLGGGINFERGGTQIRLDYAYGDFGVFDNTQRFSFIFAF